MVKQHQKLPLESNQNHNREFADQVASSRDPPTTYQMFWKP
jgi:hypothetical protein